MPASVNPVIHSHPRQGGTRVNICSNAAAMSTRDA